MAVVLAFLMSSLPPLLRNAIASSLGYMSGATSTQPSVLPRFASSIASCQAPICAPIFVGTHSLMQMSLHFHCLRLDQLACGHLLLQPPQAHSCACGSHAGSRGGGPVAGGAPWPDASLFSRVQRPWPVRVCKMVRSTVMHAEAVTEAGVAKLWLAMHAGHRSKR
jgi:hypothetical protein